MGYFPYYGLYSLEIVRGLYSTVYNPFFQYTQVITHISKKNSVFN